MSTTVARVLACMAAVALTLPSGEARAITSLPADVTVDLTGATGETALTALVDVIIVDGATAVIRLRNTSPHVSPLPDGPRLVRAGFNLANDPGPECLTFEEPTQRFQLTTPAAPFCGGVHDFAYEVRAMELEDGIRTTEALEMVLRVEPTCQAAFHFAPSTFVLAPPSSVEDATAQWGGLLDAVTGEPDGVCLRGDAELVIPTLLYTWATFYGATAETRPSPSIFGLKDRRAGSLDVTLNGKAGFDGVSNDPPLEAGIVTLRNGSGRILEQHHLNRRWAPRNLDDSCVEWLGFPVCFWFWPDDAVGGILSALAPLVVDDSNTGFDDGGDRATIEGGLILDYGAFPFANNSHETVVMKWAHPDGIERAQILFRARYDADLDGTYVDEPWIVLYALNTPAVPGGTRDEAVRVTEVTRTSVTIEVDVQLALESMRLVYVEMGVL